MIPPARAPSSDPVSMSVLKLFLPFRRIAPVLPAGLLALGLGASAGQAADEACVTCGGKVAVSGHLGKNVDVAAGQRAAELCAINILAQANAALGGNLGRIKRVIKLNGFVASTPEFVEQHLVINGASNLIANVLGEAGKHARAAVGMAALPFNAAVEIDAIMEIA